MSKNFPDYFEGLPTGDKNRRRPIKASDYATGDVDNPSVVEAQNYLWQKNRALMGSFYWDPPHIQTNESSFNQSDDSTESDYVLDLYDLRLGGKLKKEFTDSLGNDEHQVYLAAYGQNIRVKFDFYKYDPTPTQFDNRQRTILSDTPEWDIGGTIISASDVPSNEYIWFEIQTKKESGAENDGHLWQVAAWEHDTSSPSSKVNEYIYQPTISGDQDYVLVRSSMEGTGTASASLDAETNLSASATGAGSITASFQTRRPMTMVWETEEADETIELPFGQDSGNNYNYDLTVDWGDGTTDKITAHDDANRSHTYSSSGRYEVEIFSLSDPQNNMGTFDFRNEIDLSMRNKFKEIKEWGPFKMAAITNFYTCENLTVTATDTPNFDLSNGTDFSSLFEGCDSLQGNSSFNNWDVSGITSMSRWFYSTPFNVDISSWDTSSVTDMRNMFWDSAFNQDIGNWDTSSVTDMRGMFGWETPFNQDISSWDVSSVTNMESMFFWSDFNQDIGNWDVSSVTTMERMFEDSEFNQDIGNWDVSSVTDMERMFEDAIDFNQDLSSWDVSSVTDMRNMFNNTSFNQDISSWDVSNLQQADRMLGYTSMTVSNYDALLNGWSSQNVNSNVTFGGDRLYYSSEGEPGRDDLINNHSWTINYDVFAVTPICTASGTGTSSCTLTTQ